MAASSTARWQSGDDPNARDGPGRTPLHHLCQKEVFHASDAGTVSALLAAGADPNATDGFGRAPLALICAESGDKEALLALLDAGADVKLQDDWGR